MAHKSKNAFHKETMPEPAIAVKPILQSRPWRIWLVLLVFMLLFAMLGIRLVQFGFRHDEVVRLQTVAQKNQAGIRREIHDRHGRLLALDVPTSSLYADPKILIDIDETTEKLTGVLPSLDMAQIRTKLSRPKRFVWLKRHLTPDQRRAVFDLGLPGLYFMREPRRFYPLGALSAHVTGFVDLNNKGLEGLERYMDDEAWFQQKGEDKRPTEPMQLSVDLRVQHVVAHELKAAIRRYKARAGVGLVLDIRSGEVLALSSQPDFDPQDIAQALDAGNMNRATQGVFELGSVLKCFTLAMGLDEGAVVKGERIDVATPVKLGSFVIKDHHKTQDGTMSLTQIFTYSSNVGAARIARKVGFDKHRAFLSRLGLLSRLRTEAGPLGRPLQPGKWRQTDSLSMAYGYGLSVSPLQFSASAMALFNGGYRVKPTFLKRNRQQVGLNPGTPVLKPSTSRFIQRIMRENVRHGTGRAANVRGYRVGGKTGTARKAKKGGYGKQLMTSFVAIFPSESPQYLTFVLLDEPQKVKASNNQNAASSNAAPLTGAIIGRIAPLLGVNPQKGSEGI